MKIYDKLKHAIRYWLLRRLPACQHTVEMLSQSLERPLTLRERINVKLHLWICAWCQWYIEQLHVIRDAARTKGAASPESSGGPNLSAEARERIKRKLAGSS